MNWSSSGFVKDGIFTTTRRNLEQMKHCVEEALSTVNNGEAPHHAIADLEQAVDLGHKVLATCRAHVRELEERRAQVDAESPKFVRQPDGGVKLAPGGKLVKG